MGCEAAMENKVCSLSLRNFSGSIICLLGISLLLVKAM
jgi:hypothetical protein